MAVIAPPPVLPSPPPPQPASPQTPPAPRLQALPPSTALPKVQELTARPAPEASPTPTPTPTATVATHTESAKPIASMQAAPAPVEPIRPPPVAPAATPVPIPTPTASNPEGAFTALLRAQLNASKRYPTGRDISLQRPKGKVVVWFTLLRSGHLQDLGIEDTSNSIALDNAALSTVRRASFPAFPTSSWPDQASHKFTVSLDFLPPS
jgi:periplasmic protein TonB